MLRGNLVYAYAALRTLVGWKPARFTIAIGDERTRFSGYSVVGRQQPAPTAAACTSPPTPSSTTASSTWSTIGEVGKLRFLANLPKVFKGTHVDERRGAASSAPRASSSSASRPFPVYADGEHLTDLPADLRVLPRALSVLVPPAAA